MQMKSMKDYQKNYGKPVYHYHLHVMTIPVVEKEIKWSKRCKDKALVGTVKEVINQVSHSKKWKSEPLVDNEGKPVYDKNGKAVLVKSYSLLQDKFYKYMFDEGYRDFDRGIKGSSQEHLDNLQFKISKDKERLEQVDDDLSQKEEQIKNIENTINEYLSYEDTIKDISSYGKKKKLSNKVEIDEKDYEKIVQYANKGIVADFAIGELNKKIIYYKDIYFSLAKKYDALVEKTKDYLKAFSIAPKKLLNVIKEIFDLDEQEQAEKERRRIEEKANRYRAPKTNNKRRSDRDAR